MNYFDLFGLPPKFAIDLKILEAAFHRLQAELHPDRHAHHGEAARHIALQHSATVNDGYQILRDPASRAQCLLDMAGQSEQASAPLSPAFLLSQMEWHEAIDEARQARDSAALEALAKRLQHKRLQQEKGLTETLDQKGDYRAAAERIGELRFYDKLRIVIDEAMEALED